MTPYQNRLTPTTKRMAEDLKLRNRAQATINAYTYHVRRFEVDRLLQCVPNLKHRTFLLVLYAAGLRISEAANLTINDIDGERMQLRIENAKGNKQRLVPLSPRLLEALRDHWRRERPPKFLFTGKTIHKPINVNSMQKVCKAAVRESGLLKNITPHTLRHSFATGLLEAGVDILTIGRLLGHACFTTTMIYLHCRQTHFDSAPSPIDWLPTGTLPGWKQKGRNPQTGKRNQKGKNEPN